MEEPRSVRPEAAFWDKLAEGYAAQPVGDPEAFERKIAITRSKIRPGHTVLNVGCGTGSLSLRLADTGAELHGLDISGEMIRIARGKAEGVDNVHFHVGPFDDLFTIFAPGSLDGVLAYSILHLLPDRREALARIHALLKPGGFFISSTVCLGQSWLPYRPLLAVMRWLGKAPTVSIFSKAQLLAEMAEAGFVELEQPEVGAEATIAFVVGRRAGA